MQGNVQVYNVRIPAKGVKKQENGNGDPGTILGRSGSSGILTTWGGAATVRRSLDGGPSGLGGGVSGGRCPAQDPEKPGPRMVVSSRAFTWSLHDHLNMGSMTPKMLGSVWVMTPFFKGHGDSR